MLHPMAIVAVVVADFNFAFSILNIRGAKNIIGNLSAVQSLT
jgi:hypothetical protein